jgi:RIO-like serine/threonine protein kinase
MKLQGNALLKLASDGFGLLRYVQSRGRLHEFISCNTASTRARLGENSQTGSVFAALPVSNAA